MNMMATGLRIESVAETDDRLGETPLWCNVTERLWWIDIENPRLHSYDPAAGACETVALPGTYAGTQALTKAGDRLLAEDLTLYARDADTGYRCDLLSLEPGLDTASYTAELAERFANPALAHRTAQIANDGSQKLPQRILETALDRCRAGRSADHLVLVVAAWIAACEARGRSLPDAHFTAPLDHTMAGLAARNLSAADLAAAVFDAAGFAAGRPERTALVDVTARHLESLRARGPAATLAGLAATRTS